MKDFKVLKVLVTDCLLVEEATGDQNVVLSLNLYNDPTHPLYISVSPKDGGELLNRLIDCLATSGNSVAQDMMEHYY